MKVNTNTSTKVALLFCGVLLSGSVFAENVIPKGASNLPSLEFGALVKTYMIDEASKSTWSFSTNSQNILWDSGVTWKIDTRKYEKDGFVRLQFDGFKLKEDAYNNPKKVRPEAAWNITYSGKNKSNVNQISINHFLGGLISSYDEPSIQALNSLVRHNIAYEPFCFNNLGGGSQSIAYRLTSPDKKAIYIIITESAGSGGYSKYFDLFLKKADMLNYFYDITNSSDKSFNCLTVLF